MGKSLLKKLLIYFGQLTSSLRVSPRFFIIGGQKCGTTSLHNYLLQHPSICRALKKEVHYFDLDYHKGINFYKGHFPSIISTSILQIFGGSPRFPGDSTPYYSFHPLVPERIAKHFPSAKMIFLLRNPIDRAYSHYHHEVRLGVETLSFEEAIEKEEERLNGEEKKILTDPEYVSFPHQHFSYLARGRYLEQIERWQSFFNKEQLLLIKSEDFFSDPPKALAHVERFLGIPHVELKNYKKFNKFSYIDIESSTRKRLKEYFSPLNQDLYANIGQNNEWE